jgi:NADH:ubiquinone oxidoreductase subunit K
MMFSIINVSVVLILGLAAIGLYGLLIARNLIRAVVCLQIAVKAAMLALILAGRLAGKPEVGQSLAVTVIVADTIVAVVALALSVQVRRLFGTLDIQALTRLRR